MRSFFLRGVLNFRQTMTCPCNKLSIYFNAFGRSLLVIPVNRKASKWIKTSPLSLFSENMFSICYRFYGHTSKGLKQVLFPAYHHTNKKNPWAIFLRKKVFQNKYCTTWKYGTQFAVGWQKKSLLCCIA